MMKEIKKVAILTAGGDCPGLNPVIRAVTKTAITKYGLEVMGVRHGYFGLYHGDFIKLGLEDVEDIFTKGGTILYSSNKDNLFQYPVKDENGNLVRDENGKLVYEDASDVAVENLKKAGIDAIFILGGDGSLTSARDFARKGVKVIGIPKTIDNDLAHTDYTFGFDTAVTVATDGLDRVRTTGMSHHRIMVVEIMGRGAGWMTLHAGIAGAADAILIPEIPYDINKVAEKIQKDKANGKDFSIVAVAEGAKSLDGKQVVSKIIEDSADSIRLGGVGALVADQLEKLTGSEARATTLGHIQRGGTPTSRDRILSARYGYAAVELCMNGGFGRMVALRGDKIIDVSLEDVIGQKTKNVDPNGEYVTLAKAMGICFGD
ncbi:MAG: 6-phosphofructokinase [Clostridia bacterium]|nr:6-phosphofructokinase [Clostridia bacterium]